MDKKSLGRYGENIARRHYQRLGWQVISQNYWTRYGELDLVLEKNKQILIVEVKTRTNYNFGWAEESINQKKLNNIYKAYQKIQLEKNLPPDYQLEICIIQISNGQINFRCLTL